MLFQIQLAVTCNFTVFNLVEVLVWIQNWIFVADNMRAYLQQLRQEIGVRLVEKVFDPDTDKPSKVSNVLELAFVLLKNPPLLYRAGEL
jgi:hypothetical protein